MILLGWLGRLSVVFGWLGSSDGVGRQLLRGGLAASDGVASKIPSAGLAVSATGFGGFIAGAQLCSVSLQDAGSTRDTTPQIPRFCK